MQLDLAGPARGGRQRTRASRSELVAELLIVVTRQQDHTRSRPGSSSLSEPRDVLDEPVAGEPDPQAHLARHPQAFELGLRRGVSGRAQARKTSS